MQSTAVGTEKFINYGNKVGGANKEKWTRTARDRTLVVGKIVQRGRGSGRGTAFEGCLAYL